MPTTIDFEQYVRPPRIDALRGIALTIRLLRAAPPKPSRPVAASLRKLRGEAVGLQSELKARGRTRPESLKPLDTSFDFGWSAFRDRLVAWDRVQSKPLASLRARALQLVAAYFPDGVEFVKLAYEAEWVQSQQLLERFDEEGAIPDLERLAGAEFLANVRDHHVQLGTALGLTGKRGAEEIASTTGVAERVTALAMAIAEYSRRLAGEVDTDDDESVAAFQKAMRPLDDHRAEALSGGTKPAEPVDPATPIPPAPEE